MPFAAYTDTVSGHDSIALSGVVQVLFVAVRLTALGDDVRYTEQFRTDHILRAGWVSLGDHFDIGSDMDRDYWRAPIWCDFPNTLWTPEPTNTTTGLDPATVLASRVRYSFGVGTTAQILVFAL